MECFERATRKIEKLKRIYKVYFNGKCPRAFFNGKFTSFFNLEIYKVCFNGKCTRNVLMGNLQILQGFLMGNFLPSLFRHTSSKFLVHPSCETKLIPQQKDGDTYIFENSMGARDIYGATICIPFLRLQIHLNAKKTKWNSWKVPCVDRNTIFMLKSTHLHVQKSTMLR